MEAVILNKLTEVAQQQAVVGQQQAVANERMAGLMERISENLERAEASHRRHVELVGKDTVMAVVADNATRDGWWKKLAALIAVIQLSDMLINLFKK